MSMPPDESEIPPMREEVCPWIVNMRTGAPTRVRICNWCETIGGHSDACWARQVAYWKQRAREGPLPRP